VVPAVFSEEISASVPEIEHATRLMSRGLIDLKHDDQEYVVPDFVLVDPSFFDLFSYDFLAGNPETALENPDSLVITEEIAHRIFGEKDPLGETLTMAVENMVVNPFRVTGVLRDIPKNSHVRFDALGNIKGLQYLMNSNQAPGFLQDPYYCRLETFFLLKAGFDIPDVEKKINRIAQDKWGGIYRDRGTTREFFLLNIQDIHLHSPNEDETVPAGDINNIYLFSAIAFLVLLIACFNFINLSTARSANRAGEIGVRKVIGSQRSQLIRQFLFESVLISLFGLLIGLLIVLLALPVFNGLLDKQIESRALFNSSVLAAILGVIILTGIGAGSFPAFVLSSFDPVRVLKGKLRSVSKNRVLRKFLVIFQFAASVFMIIGVLTIIKQMDYIKEKNLGFHKEQMVVITSPGDDGDVLRQKILQNPGVESVSFSVNVPGIFIAYQAYNPTPEDSERETLRAYQMIGDYDFIQTYGLEIVQGRSFSNQYSTDAEEAILINEKTAEILGWGENAVGKKLYNVAENNRERTVIGVLKNFHLTGLKQEISPLIMELEPTDFRYVSARLNPNSVPEALAYLENVFMEVHPGQDFSYYFIDDAFRRMYPEEDKLGQIYLTFGFLTVFVACLGLFGLSTFSAAQRTKEIGVRKVLGASFREIITLLSKEFAALILAANFLAWPLAFFVMRGWLQSFVYRIDITWDIFFLSGILALAVALLTISHQSIKAAVSSPVDSLRYE
jgi:putative ABC transport system permease protein